MTPTPPYPDNAASRPRAEAPPPPAELRALCERVAELARRVCDASSAQLHWVGDDAEWHEVHCGAHTGPAQAWVSSAEFGAPRSVVQGALRIGGTVVPGATARQMLKDLADIAGRAIALAGTGPPTATDASTQDIPYRAIVEDQAEFISLARPDGELIYVNPAYAALFGRTTAQLQGANLFDFVQEADRPAVLARLTEVADTGTLASSENRMLAADGSERWVAWTNAVQRQPHGVVLLHSVGRDITARKRAEAALRESQAFLFRTGRVAGVGGWEYDVDRGVLTWSEQLRRIHDVVADFVPTLRAAVQFYADEVRARVQRVIGRCLDFGEPWDLELPLVTATGRSIWVRAMGEAEYGAGRVVKLIGAVQDISQRKQLEQRLADSERFVRQITDSLPVRIAYTDLNLRLQFVNLAHLRRFGMDRDEVIGRTYAELLPAALADEVTPHIEAVLSGQTQHFEFDESVGGRWRRIENQFIPDIDEDSQVRGFFSTGVDITERNAAERALRELTTILEATTDYVVQTDRTGRVTYMNPAARRATGVADDADLSGRNFAEFNTPQTNRLFVDVVVPAVRQRGVWLGESSVYLAGRRETPVSHLVIAHRGVGGEIERYSAVMRDISVESAVKQSMQRHAATLHSVAEAIPAAVTVVDNDGIYRFANSAFERWRGRPRDAIIGRAVDEVLGAAEVERRAPWMRRALAGHSVSFERDGSGPDSLRHYSISLIPLTLESGQTDGFVEVTQDVTAQKLEALRLEQLAQRDALTGVLNRVGFEKHLERLLTQGDGGSVALLYIDLDRFKPVNDVHGHAVGDQVLQMFAQRLLRLVRPTDAVARLGGDEFAVILSGVHEIGNVPAVADKIIAAACAPFEIGTRVVHVGASVGVAFGADRETGWGDLVGRADSQLYRAKAAGRGRSAGAEDGG